MIFIYNSKQKGIGIEHRKCLSCGNIQDVIAIDGTITIFFKCEKCETKTFLQDVVEEYLTPNMIIDTT